MQGQVGSKGSSPRAAVNKKFLLNTVHGLKSHNKREEEEDCWRQHDLDQKAKEGRRSRSHDAACRARRERSTDAVRRAASPVSEVDTRQFWAEQKRKAMTAALVSPSGDAPLEGGRPDAKHGDRRMSRDRQRPDGSEDEASLSDDDRKKRKRKKGERKARKKKKRKRESKHSSGGSGGRSNSGSSGDSSSESDAESRRDGAKASDKRHHRRKRKKSKKRSSRKKSKT
eukprot:g4931.t1